MKVELKHWTKDVRNDLAEICNAVDRQYLTNRLPYPYTYEDADWWLNMASEREGRNLQYCGRWGVCRQYNRGKEV